MNKPTLSLSEITYRILRERKFNKMVAEITAAMKSSSKMLKEAGIPSGIDQGLLKVSKEVEKDGEDMDMDDQEVQAAMMMAALEKGGDISKVKPSDVEGELPTVDERRQSVNESGGGVLDSIFTVISLVLGNAAFIEAICAGIEAATGKKMDPVMVKTKLGEFDASIKALSGWLMKKFGQGVEWVIRKLGGGPNAQKIGAVAVKFIVVVALFALGVTHFPLAGASVFGIIISITSMIGKGFELIVLGKKLIKSIRKAIADNKELKAKLQASADDDKVANMRKATPKAPAIAERRSKRIRFT